jgi:hypothetical protein
MPTKYPNQESVLQIWAHISWDPVEALQRYLFMDSLSESDLCQVISTIETKASHESQCQFRPVSCRWCNVEVLKAQLEEHENICNQGIIECICGAEEKKFNMKVVVYIYFTEIEQNHINNECSKGKMNCPNCFETMERGFFSAHLDENCPGTKYYFKIQLCRQSY